MKIARLSSLAAIALLATGMQAAQHSKSGKKKQPPKTAKAESGTHRNEKGKGNNPIVPTWSPINFGGTEVQGGVGLTVNHDGSWRFTGHFFNNDSVAHTYGIAFGLRAAGSDGTLFLFESAGNLNSSHGMNWNKHGKSDDIRKHWDALVKAHDWKGRGSIGSPPVESGVGVGQTNAQPPPPVNLGALVNQVEIDLKAVGEIKTVVR